MACYTRIHFTRNFTNYTRKRTITETFASESNEIIWSWSHDSWVTNDDTWRKGFWQSVQKQRWKEQKENKGYCKRVLWSYQYRNQFINCFHLGCLFLTLNIFGIFMKYCPANISPFKLNNNPKKSCEICSKLTTKTLEQRLCRCSSVLIVNFNIFQTFL